MKERGGKLFAIIGSISYALGMDYMSWRKEFYGQDKPVFFHEKMPGSVLPWAKVRTPHIKEMAAKAALDPGFDLTMMPLDESVDLLQAYVFANLKRIPSFEEQLRFLDSKSPYLVSWMATDGVFQFFKKPTFALFQPFFLRLLKKSDVFSKRLAYVTALGFAKDEGHLLFLKHIQKDERYYVYMAEAWLLATIAIWDYSGVKALLLSDKLTIALKRKTISKMRDSYRIPEEVKEEVKKIRDGDYIIEQLV